MSRFLQHIKIDRYGAFADYEMGPLTPGLNVIHGPNEAGKTTVASFIGATLFGWEDAHGVRNTYRYDGSGDRSGSLVWHDELTGTSTICSRDESGISGDTSMLEDIDEATFRTVFALTSEELRSLRGTSDVTARLLTAGSGAESSPAQAFVNIEQQIAALTAPAREDGMVSPKRGDGDSVFQLEKQLESLRGSIKEASAKAALLVQEDRELRELKATRESTARQIEALNEELESLSAWRAELRSIDRRSQNYTEEVTRLRENLLEIASASEEASTIDPRLIALDSAAERTLRDKLDELSEEQEKLDRIVDTAKENSSTSSAAYEALCEIDAEEVEASRKLRNRPSQAVLSVILPLAFVAIGVPLFVHGRQINSLSFSALGIGLIVAAVFLAAAAFFVLFRAPSGAEALENRRKDAQWVMLQDRKKLDACLQDREQFAQATAAFFEESGLAAADGSIRQARSLLEEAGIERAARRESNQRVSSIELRIQNAENELASLEASRLQIAEAAGVVCTRPVDDGVSEAKGTSVGETPIAQEIDRAIRVKGSQRDALLEAAEGMGERFGELTRELELARNDRSLDALKLEYQQVRVRLRETKSQLISLLLAKRLLERSIAEWERQGQPEVYEQAGRLLETITSGAWVKVSTSSTGSLVAQAADGTTRDPRHLSLGTCQQLYLALRIAVLIQAPDVGRAIPVLADDILVNFDDERRAGAARALAELARHRQVIVFTCHFSTASALLEADGSANVISIG